MPPSQHRCHSQLVWDKSATPSCGVTRLAQLTSRATRLVMVKWTFEIRQSEILVGGVGEVCPITPPMYISMVEEATDILKCTFQNHL